MVHLLERSLIDLSELIKKETGNEYLSDIASQLATWSTHYIPFHESYGYTFLRINRFNLGKDPVVTLNERIEKIVQKKSPMN